MFKKLLSKLLGATRITLCPCCFQTFVVLDETEYACPYCDIIINPKEEQ